MLLRGIANDWARQIDAHVFAGVHFGINKLLDRYGRQHSDVEDHRSSRSVLDDALQGADDHVVQLLRGQCRELEERRARVAQPLDLRLPESVQRDRVAKAFERHGYRGTRASLEATLTEVAGVPVRITEPMVGMSHWLLGESPLGWRTMLVTAEPQGAVVGTSAEVDRSYLITDEDVGWPLDADVAHRFCVHVAATLPADREAALRAAVESEKPAHTLATICVDEPRVRIGYGQGVGAEMVVGGRPVPAAGRTEAAVGGRVGGIPIGGRQ